MIPEAPSPKRCSTDRDDQGMVERVGAEAMEKVGVQGFPANERNESSGREKRNDGKDVRLLDERRRRPSFRQ